MIIWLNRHVLVDIYNGDISRERSDYLGNINLSAFWANNLTIEIEFSCAFFADRVTAAN